MSCVRKTVRNLSVDKVAHIRAGTLQTLKLSCDFRCVCFCTRISNVYGPGQAKVLEIITYQSAVDVP